MFISKMKWGVRKEGNVRWYNTMVRDDHKLGGNNYVLGKISGYADVILDGYRDITWNRNAGESGFYFSVLCNDQAYEKFRSFVEYRYPGLCDFDCERKINETIEEV